VGEELKMQEMTLIPNSDEISLPYFLNHFTLIIGEVNRGKTTLTQKILDLYCRNHGGPVTVVDLAPSIEPGVRTSHGGVGGKLSIPSSPDIRCFHGSIHAPRLEAKDEGEALVLAEENARLIESLFLEAFQEEVLALFVNDCSLYLHGGEAKKLLEWIGRAKTAVVNGYYGHSLGQGLISSREKEGMDYLMTRCDRLIRL
jgi:hypothetical protein